MSISRTGLVIATEIVGDIASYVFVSGCPDLFSLPRRLYVAPAREMTNSQRYRYERPLNIGDEISFEADGRIIQSFERMGRNQELEFRANEIEGMQVKVVCSFSSETPRRCHSAILGILKISKDLKDLARVLHDVPVNCWVTLGVHGSQFDMYVAELIEIPYDSEDRIVGAPWAKQRGTVYDHRDFSDEEADFMDVVQKKVVDHGIGGLHHPNGFVFNARGVMITRTKVFLVHSKKVVTIGLLNPGTDHPKIGSFVSVDTYPSSYHETNVVFRYNALDLDGFPAKGESLLVDITPQGREPGIYKHNTFGCIYDRNNVISDMRTRMSESVYIRYSGREGRFIIDFFTQPVMIMGDGTYRVLD